MKTPKKTNLLERKQERKPPIDRAIFKKKKKGRKGKKEERNKEDSDNFAVFIPLPQLPHFPCLIDRPVRRHCE